MKKLNLLLMLLLVSFFAALGKEVPVTTARNVGYNYLVQKGDGVLKSPDDLKLSYTSGSGTALFYVFSSDHSFVMVAAEDRVTPVLGYSKENQFRTDDMPVNVKGFLEGYSGQIQYVIDKQIAATPEIETDWNNLMHNIPVTTASKTTAVTPLMSTIWNQSPYYNAYCPYDAPGGGLSVTGCVATATAQVMKFWNWPAHGTGIHSYSTTAFGTLTANFGATTYNWAAMPNNVTAANPAVARLMSDVGISINMDYSASSSGAYVISSSTATAPYCAEYSLKNYFNYDPSLHGEQRSGYSDATWTSMLESDLSAGRPIIYAGFGTGGGHCFVLDGFDASHFFHINWGWGGSSDGYFAINALNPPGTGIGGGSGGYNSGQQAILGVKPYTTGTGTTASLALYDYVNLSASTIGYGAPFTVTTNVLNTGTSTYTGDFCAAAFDATTGTFITFIDSVMGTTLPPGNIFSSPYISIPTSGLLALLPGTYSIGVFYRATGSNWVAVPNSGSYTNFELLTVVNSNYMEVYSTITPSPAVFVQGSAASVNLNVYNSSAFNFSGSFDVSLYNLDGTFACNVQTLTGMSLAGGYVYTTPFLTFSTANITAAPGTYLLAMEYNDGSGWALGGADYFSNPIYVTVVAPALSPDIYEVNNTAATAYNLTPSLTWVSDASNAKTTGSNIHINSDQDYYKVVLAAGYNYIISARVNDQINTDDALPYTTDAIWSYSTDGGANWSSVYDNTMTGTIVLPGLAGGTVIFHVSPHYAGNTGTYILKIGNITRTTSSVGMTDIDLSAISIYPNPASDNINIDLSGSGAAGITATLMDMQGRKIVVMDAANQSMIKMPVGDLPAGVYLLQVLTTAGIQSKKIVVGK